MTTNKVVLYKCMLKKFLSAFHPGSTFILKALHFHMHDK
jgi:hypothetical protein